ncbi:MAG: MFS transporter [Caldilineaceae bacterium]
MNVLLSMQTMAKGGRSRAAVATFDEAAAQGNMGRWSVIVDALIVQAILGTVYAFSVFVRPLEMEFGWDRTTTQWAFSFALASFAITMIPAGRLQDRMGPRVVATIGGILLGISFLLERRWWTAADRGRSI